MKNWLTERIVLAVLLFFCYSSISPVAQKKTKQKTQKIAIKKPKKVNAMTKHDLVEVTSINPSIVLDIKYATADNFTGKQLYKSARCFLQKPVALKLDKIQQELKPQGLGLKIYDGYRPHAIQYLIWDICPNPAFVHEPSKGSCHNRGAAVDLTLIRLSDGKELEMPTAFDEMTKRAYRSHREGISQEALANCALLEKIMVKYDFIPLPTEWWHFNDKDWQSYPLLNIPFEEIAKST